MKSAPIAATRMTTATSTVPVASPRLPPYFRSSQSTAGLRASARNSAMKTHDRMCREIHSSRSVIPTATTIPITSKTVLGRKKTTRSCAGGTSPASRGRRTVAFRSMSLRGRTIEQTATLPDGRHVTVHVGVPEDPYIPRGELETVDVELHAGGRVLAAVNKVLGPDQESEALQLARDIKKGRGRPATPRLFY